jgi:hypothetical protein
MNEYEKEIKHCKKYENIFGWFGVILFVFGMVFNINEVLILSLLMFTKSEIYEIKSCLFVSQSNFEKVYEHLKTLHHN